MLKQGRISDYNFHRKQFLEGEVFKRSTWRKKVVERDGHCCNHCFGLVQDIYRKRKPLLEAHHIIARRHGGTNTLANGITLCTFCHNYFDYMYSTKSLDYYQILESKSKGQRLTEIRELLKQKYFSHLLYIIRE